MSGSGGMVNGGGGKALDPAPGAGVKQPNFDDPSLEHLGEPLPGAILTVKLRSKPGTYSRLFWGTTPTVQPSAGVLVDKLVVKEATIPIGIVPASGVLTTPFMIDPSLPPGSTIFLQAMSIFPSGKIRRTNSVPIVVR